MFLYFNICVFKTIDKTKIKRISRYKMYTINDTLYEQHICIL